MEIGRKKFILVLVGLVLFFVGSFFSKVVFSGFGFEKLPLVSFLMMAATLIFTWRFFSGGKEKKQVAIAFVNMFFLMLYFPFASTSSEIFLISLALGGWLLIFFVLIKYGNYLPGK